MTLAVGTPLHHGKYVIQHPVDAGDRTVTYIATHTSLNETVRLRTLSDPDQAQPEHRHRFLETGRRLYHCRHPHLARVLDSFVEQDQPFLVLEHPADEALDAAIARQPLTQADALRVIHQIGGALVALHHQGIAHGAVSPQTILLRSGTLPMALLVGVTIGAAADHPARSPIGDMQALARTLYTALTGQTLMDEAIDVLAILHRLKQAQPELNPLVEQAILQALQPAEHQPFSSMAHWLSTLPQVSGAALSIPSVAVESDSAPVLSPPASTTHPVTEPAAMTSEAAPVKAVSSPTRSPHAVSVRSKPRSRWFPITVCVASVMAAIGGAGTGLLLRFDDPERPDRSGLLFNSEQSFPASDEWPGTSMTDDTESSDYLFESPGWSSPTQTDYYSAPGELPEYVPPGETDTFYPSDVYSEESADPLTEAPMGDRRKPDIASDAPLSDEVESDWSTDLPTEPSSDSKLEDVPAVDPVLPDVEPSIPEPSFEEESSVTAPADGAEPLSRTPDLSEVVTQ